MGRESNPFYLERSNVQYLFEVGRKCIALSVPYMRDHAGRDIDLRGILSVGRAHSEGLVTSGIAYEECTWVMFRPVQDLHFPTVIPHITGRHCCGASITFFVLGDNQATWSGVQGHAVALVCLLGDRHPR